MSTASSLISPKELKELRRVFDTLCHYADRHPRPSKPASAGEQTPQIPAFARSRGHDDDDDGEYTVQSTNTTGLSLMSNVSSLRLLEPHTDCIRAKDIAAALRDLGTRTSKQEVQEMLWEADEKNDNVIDWEELKLMFERNLRDASGLEPANLYHVVQFMIFDRNCNGKVSIDETMNILYARLGREKMESTLSKLFSADGAPVEERGSQGGEITFKRFASVARKEQSKKFEDSEMGKLLMARRK